MKKLILSIVLVSILATATGCNSDKNDQNKDIEKIYYYSLNIGFTEAEYQMDLKNNKLFEFTTYPDNIEVRDPDSENEGYQQVSDLVPEKTEAFLKDARKYRFADWDESYILENSYDGYQWGITITFSDGTIKEITGRNAFPETWDQMAEAFEELTGKEIIHPIE